MKTNMHFGAYGRLFAYARHNRMNPTEAEQILWEKLRANQTGHKFRRQHPIFDYVVDFYCLGLKYAIEVDGGVHLNAINQLEDESKDLTLKENGIFVQRFTNKEILLHIEYVMSQIHQTISNLEESHGT